MQVKFLGVESRNISGESLFSLKLKWYYRLRLAYLPSQNYPVKSEFFWPVRFKFFETEREKCHSFFQTYIEGFIWPMTYNRWIAYFKYCVYTSYWRVIFFLAEWKRKRKMSLWLSVLWHFNNNSTFSFSEQLPFLTLCISWRTRIKLTSESRALLYLSRLL